MKEPALAKEIRDKIDTVFYRGRVMPAHTAHEHFYQDTEDGSIYASVTTKTSLLGRKYYKQMAADKAVDHIQEGIENGEELATVFAEARLRHKVDLEQAGTWGTHGHDMVDGYVSKWISDGVRPADIRGFATKDTSPQGVCAALGAMKFFDDYKMYPIVSEKKVISKKHKYGGTLDSLWLVKVKGKWKLILGDYKTSNQIYGRGAMGKPDYGWQVMAYSKALEEMTGIKCNEHWIIRLDKNQPKYEIGYIANPRKSWRGFLAMNTISDEVRSKEDPILPLIKKERITL
jgi:hypothetical protein